jgi:hypothetical protein
MKKQGSAANHSSLETGIQVDRALPTAKLRDLNPKHQQEKAEK